MKSRQKLKELHDVDYVQRFDALSNQNNAKIFRLLRFCSLKTTDLVVDFACGSGMLMPFISGKVSSYYGVDFSESFIESAIKKMHDLNINNAQFFNSEIGEFCINHPNEFDVGFAMDFSEHVYDKEWVEILKSIKLSLKKNGKLYLHTPNADFFLEVMRNKNCILKQRDEHVAVRNPAENVRLLKEAGFSIVNLTLLPHYNILKYIHPLSFIPIIGKYLKARIFIEAIV